MFFIYYLVLFSVGLVHSAKQPKNVVIVIADDLGLNDVSYRGSNEIPTYNIDALAYGGIILNNYRTPPMCTPSRSALMTSKYPHRIGMHDFVIVNDEPWGLPPKEKIMPQYFKEAGYVTRLIGKWHLGFFQDQYLPNNRGFDSFFGYYGGYIDYWNYTHKMLDRSYSRGYDLRRNSQAAQNFTAKYATELFTDEAVKQIKSHDKEKPLFLIVSHLAPHAGNEDFPMQAKVEDVQRFVHIKSEKRRKLAAMIYQLDKSVGEIVKALKVTNMLDDTIVIFYSDNGGPTVGLHSTEASNYPLRGQKMSGWEGAIRTNAIIYSSSLPQSIVRDKMFYVGDWLPTLKTLSGAKFRIGYNIDGIDQTKMLKNGLSLRNELVTYDQLGYGSYISHNFKYVFGTLFNGKYDTWLGSNSDTVSITNTEYMTNLQQSEIAMALQISFSAKLVDQLKEKAEIICTKSKINNICNLEKGPCLFNIVDDPCEENNLAKTLKFKLSYLSKRFTRSLANIVPSRRKPSDSRCDPANFDFTWSPWIKNEVTV